MSWWDNAVIYQVYIRSFKDSNRDGVGDIPGIASKLDYFRDLGVDAIWITPFYPSPMFDFGYDVSDYCGVDDIFGDIDQFKALLNSAHKKNIRVIIDFVPNHTSHQHPWFKESRESKTIEKRDWYIWADPAENGGPPNNWQSRFGGGPAWTYDIRTGQYYLHSFLPEQPDLNWRHPEVKSAMEKVITFWLEMGVDGLRVDVCDRLIKDYHLRDNPLNPNWTNTLDPAQKYTQTYSKNLPENHEINKFFRSITDRYPDICLIGESYLPSGELAAYYGEGDEYHLMFNFGLILCELTPRQILRVLAECYATLPASACASWALGNHDRSRIASRIGKERAKIAMMLLLLLKGSPTIYYADELGVEDVKIPQEKLVDPWGKSTPTKARDKVRTPMAWNNLEGGGFTEGGVDPWLPLHANYQRLNVALLQQQPKSIINMTKELIHLRKITPALRDGDIELVESDACSSDELCFVRRDAAAGYLVQLNFSAHHIPRRKGQLLYCSGESADPERVAPYEGVVIKI